MDWLGNNVKTFKVKGITIIANRNNGMVIGLDREGEEVVDLLKSNLIEISSLSDNQKELYKVLEENDFLKSCYKEIKGIDSVYLHVNSACNLHCLGCYSYVENRNTRNELSFDEWKCVIDDLSLLGVKNIVISGGEPFLRKDLREICKYIKETVNGSLEVISNGTMNISDYEVVLPYIDKACFICSVTVQVMILQINNKYPLELFVAWGIILVSSICIWKLSPVENINHELKKEEKEHCRKVTGKILGAIFIAAGCCTALGMKKYLSLIALTALTVFISQCIGIIKYKVEKEKN